MATEATTEADRIESLTIRHLRELRSHAQLLIEAMNRNNDRLHYMESQIEGRFERMEDRFGRIEGELRHIKSDIILLENRSFTALANDTYHRSQLEAIGEGFTRLEARLENRLDAIDAKLGIVPAPSTNPDKDDTP